MCSCASIWKFHALPCRLLENLLFCIMCVKHVTPFCIRCFSDHLCAQQRQWLVHLACRKIVMPLYYVHRDSCLACMCVHRTVFMWSLWVRLQLAKDSKHCMAGCMTVWTLTFRATIIFSVFVNQPFHAYTRLGQVLQMVCVDIFWGWLSESAQIFPMN